MEQRVIKTGGGDPRPVRLRPGVAHRHHPHPVQHGRAGLPPAHRHPVQPHRRVSHHYSFVDLTDTMEEYIDHWKRLDLTFDCIYSGFLGSVRQIEIVAGFLDHFGGEDTLAVVDPVMGDNGRLYSSMKPRDHGGNERAGGQGGHHHPQFHGGRFSAGRTLP